MSWDEVAIEAPASVDLAAPSVHSGAGPAAGMNQMNMTGSCAPSDAYVCACAHTRMAAADLGYREGV